MNKPSGFTLIEMLIVTTLLTLVLYTGNYVYYQ
ncbi:prepilin-type N-terminal cleavage/methylation domain-containing protein, partial [Pseudoalteromonas ruthenica]